MSTTSTWGNIASRVAKTGALYCVAKGCAVSGVAETKPPMVAGVAAQLAAWVLPMKPVPIMPIFIMVSYIFRQD
jgi:hypothetical protein